MNYSKQDLKKIEWLRILRSKGIGPKKFIAILNKRYACSFEKKSFTEAEEEFIAHKKHNAFLIDQEEEIFPHSLKKLNDCPPLLSMIGEKNTLNQPSIAIVGGRNASLGGKKIAYTLAKDLAEEGWVIVSGMARGIDGKAHEGALTTGKSVAILAGGVDYIYPLEHKGLYDKLKSKGAILSEMPLGSAPTASLFIRRNRLIAGLSKAIILIEAKKGSGSLTTANFALEQGIDVFVVPGSPLDPRNHGCHELIKQGAALIENAQDVIDNLAHSRSHHAPTFKKEYTINFQEPLLSDLNLREKLLSHLSFTPCSIEDLLFDYQSFKVKEILETLTILEIEGKILRTQEGEFILAS